MNRTKCFIKNRHKQVKLNIFNYQKWNAVTKEAVRLSSGTKDLITPEQRQPRYIDRSQTQCSGITGRADEHIRHEWPLKRYMVR